jgi:hypothetical protein
VVLENYLVANRRFHNIRKVPVKAILRGMVI